MDYKKEFDALLDSGKLEQIMYLIENDLIDKVHARSSIIQFLDKKSSMLLYIYYSIKAFFELILNISDL
mgnify:CR=1 FL=1